MCGIAGVVSLNGQPLQNASGKLAVMNDLQKHRGPDGSGKVLGVHYGLGHVRLAIIDLDTGTQPMQYGDNWLTYNGEVYNYRELRSELGGDWQTTSDTEVILRAYERWGADCVQHFRGMFAFALWDEKRHSLFCARDRFGIKPFYYAVQDATFYFASEVKALLPFIDIETDIEGFRDYVTFQFCLGGKTLCKGVNELPPGHTLIIHDGQCTLHRYWQLTYEPDWDHTPRYFERHLRELICDAVDYHLRSDVPVGAYISGGLDSSIVASVASKQYGKLAGFHGTFNIPGYDESPYAESLAQYHGFSLDTAGIESCSFSKVLPDLIYHLDFPVAGPGSFPQFLVSSMAADHRKVVLGGQGGDEIFGGYARYLAAYFEQCIKGAIGGSLHNGNYVVTYESIIPTLPTLQAYVPLLTKIGASALTDEMDRTYFKLVNRADDITNEINWDALNHYDPFETFRSIFHGDGVRKESYFDLMTRFDFKTLLPALLHVEDRVSMAHGLESRVPFLDHPLVEFTATMPADVKFKDGTMKGILKRAMADYLPPEILNRKDKMGFPVPISEWVKGECRDFVLDTLTTQAARSRSLVDNRAVVEGLEKEPRYGRKIWGFLCLELWQQTFHDQADKYRKMMEVK